MTAVLALSGAALFFSTQSLALAAPGFGGRAHGGYGPLVGSAITLYVAGSTGYRSAGKPIASATTDSSGNFNFSAYTCPADNPMTYVTAAGGKSGGVTAANASIRLILGLGPCASIPPTVIINELSTVATVYALSAFTDPSTLDIGAPSATSVGMANAFALINSMYGVTTGVAGPLFTQPGLPVSAVEKFNSLADVLVSCVNSAPPFTACSTLFTAATTPSGATPVNTQQALTVIAQHPGDNVAAIYAQQALVSGPLPYTPGLPVAPNQWLLAIFHNLGSNTQPEELAVDAKGNLFIADEGLAGGAGGLIRITPAGGLSEITTDASNPFGVAVAASGDVWVTNQTNGTLVGYSSTGAVIAGPITGLTNARTVAIDQTGNVWVANTGANSVLEFSSAGTLLRTVKNVALLAPYDITVDSSGNVWSANEGSNSISMISATSVTSFNGNGVTQPKGIVTDGLGSIWVGNSDGTMGISRFSSTGAAIDHYTGGGTGSILRLASDGLDNIWAADFTAQALTELTSDGVAISPPTGYVARSLIKAPQTVAIDPSGNVWVSDLGSSGVAEFVGAAAPTKTPLIGPAMLP